MKKILLASALALFGAVSVNAQQEKGNFKVGAHLGFPTGDFADGYGFNIGADVAYVYPIAENFKIGVTTGYSHYFGKTINRGRIYSFEIGDLGIIPVAATAQYNFDKFFVGADLGYGFATGKEARDYDLKGGFYIQPKVGYTLANKHEVYVSYKNISLENTKANANAFNVGYAFNF